MDVEDLTLTVVQDPDCGASDELFESLRLGGDRPAELLYCCSSERAGELAESAILPEGTVVLAYEKAVEEVWDEAVASASGGHVCIVRDDFVVMPGVLSEMLRIAGQTGVQAVLPCVGSYWTRNSHRYAYDGCSPLAPQWLDKRLGREHFRELFSACALFQGTVIDRSLVEGCPAPQFDAATRALVPTALWTRALSTADAVYAMSQTCFYEKCVLTPSDPVSFEVWLAAERAIAGLRCDLDFPEAHEAWVEVFWKLCLHVAIRQDLSSDEVLQFIEVASQEARACLDDGWVEGSRIDRTQYKLFRMLALSPDDFYAYCLGACLKKREAKLRWEKKLTKSVRESIEEQAPIVALPLKGGLAAKRCARAAYHAVRRK